MSALPPAVHRGRAILDGTVNLGRLPRFRPMRASVYELLAALVLLTTPASALVEVGRCTSTRHLHSAASLCVDAFVDFTGPFATFQRNNAVKEWEQQLLARQEAGQHTLLVATSGGSDDGTVLGCVECGLLPPPPRPKSTEAAPRTAGVAPAQANTLAVADVPYLANLVVAPAGRRRGLGARLVASTEDCAREWGHSELCIKVDRKNFEARRLYDRLGYELVYLQNARPTGWSNRQVQYLFLRKDLGAEGPARE